MTERARPQPVADYVELRCRSAFSFLDGASLPEDLVAAAARQGYGQLALADRNGLSGAPRFFAAAKKMGVRPIVGAEVTLADAPPLLLLVEDRRGYQNLCRLITRMSAGHAKGEATATVGLLAEHAAGLIALAGAAPRADLPALIDIFGAPNIFLETQRHLEAAEAHRARAAEAQAAAHRIGFVATNDVRYATPAQERVYDVLTCARAHATVDEIGRRLPPNGERWLKSPAEMAALFRDLTGGAARDARHRRALRVHARRSRLHLPQLSGAGGRDPAELPREDDLARRRQALPGGRSGERAAAAQGAPPGGARAGDHRQARARRLLPGGVGHRRVRARERHHDPGARLGGELRHLLRPGHHRRRPGGDGAAVRALSLRGAREERQQRRRPHARHRSRSAVGRSSASR